MQPSVFMQQVNSINNEKAIKQITLDTTDLVGLEAGGGRMGHVANGPA